MGKTRKGPAWKFCDSIVAQVQELEIGKVQSIGIERNNAVTIQQQRCGGRRNVAWYLSQHVSTNKVEVGAIDKVADNVA